MSASDPPGVASRARSPPLVRGLLAGATIGAVALAIRAGAGEVPPHVAVLAGAVAALASAAAWSAARAARLERARVLGEAERATLAARLERLTRHAPDMVLLADEQHRLVEVNDRAVTLLGHSRDELLRMCVRELRDPATLADYEERVREQIRQGVSLFSTRFRRKDGTTFPVEVSVTAALYEGRRYFEAIARDVSDRARAEEALRESEAKYRAAFEHANLGVLLVDPSGRLVEANRAIRDITGYGDAELRALPLSALDDPGQPEPSLDASLAQMRAGAIERVALSRRVRRRDGGACEVFARASALRDASGALRCAVVLVEDVSEKKRMEAQLQLAGRMASVGTLAAGVAHEINNPLSFILSNLDFALQELHRTGDRGDVAAALEEARDGGVRVREIVRDLRTFSRPADGPCERVDLRRVLQSAVGLAANEIRHRAALVVDPGDVPPVVASEHRLGQVFLNLLINAAQAIPDGRAADHSVRVTTGTAPDGRAVVEIADSGAGIPPEVLPRIFDPFFTTKPVGVGTGLGLSICHGIVSQLGGEIAVESAPGRGSTFRVLLPPAPPAREDAPAAEAPPAPARAPRRGRVLVVDDDVLVGRAVARVLAAEHEVVTRTSARAALAELLGGAGPFDVVLCDLMMPELTGMQLHAALAVAVPTLAARTVFLTGGAFTPAAQAFLDAVPNPRLEKPFDPGALRDAVARVLGGARGAAEA